jgi:hypothetical protein
MDAKLDTVDEADEVVVDPPRKSKKADKDRAKKIVSGKTSMALPQRESLTDRACCFPKLSTLTTSLKERRPPG